MSKQGSRQGSYQIDEIVNGKSSWKKGTHTIWFVPKYNDWAIGSFTKIETNIRGIISFDHQGDKSIIDVPNDKWNYRQWDYLVWKSVQTGDVTLKCVVPTGSWYIFSN